MDMFYHNGNLKELTSIFSLMLFGCFIPFQVVLLPMARVLGLITLAGSISGLVFVHVIYGIGFTTLFFRNYYVSIPSELVKAAKMDGATSLEFLSQYFSSITSIIVVTVIGSLHKFGMIFCLGFRFQKLALSQLLLP